MTTLRRLAACCLLAAGPIAATAQQEAIRLQAYTFRHQSAEESVALVQPLLSERGTVELQPGGNTIVVRDVQASLSRILPMLRQFDHPVRALALEVLVVRASRAVMSPPVAHSDLPPDLTRRLRSLLPYEIYDLEAKAELATAEGQEVAYDLGPDYRVSFRVGTVLGDQRIRLARFKVERTPRAGSARGKPLLFTNLNLALDQTMSLGLAKSEESRQALMIVLTMRSDERRSDERRSDERRAGGREP